MADCEKLEACLFFNDKLNKMPAMANLLKNKYCRGVYSECARYVVCTAIGKDKVPADLFPNMTDKARAILSSAVKQ